MHGGESKQGAANVRHFGWRWNRVNGSMVAEMAVKRTGAVPNEAQPK
jgi:hypothetical protein